MGWVCAFLLFDSTRSLPVYAGNPQSGAGWGGGERERERGRGREVWGWDRVRHMLQRGECFNRSAIYETWNHKKVQLKVRIKMILICSPFAFKTFFSCQSLLFFGLYRGLKSQLFQVIFLSARTEWPHSHLFLTPSAKVYNFVKQLESSLFFLSLSTPSQHSSYSACWRWHWWWMTFKIQIYRAHWITFTSSLSVSLSH